MQIASTLTFELDFLLLIFAPVVSQSGNLIAPTEQSPRRGCYQPMLGYMTKSSFKCAPIAFLLYSAEIRCMTDLDPNHIIFDFAVTEPYEIAAALFSLIAYPPAQYKSDKIDLCALGLITKYLHYKRKTDDTWAASYQKIKPIYLDMNESQFEQIEKKFDETLQDRLNAAFIAKRWLEETKNPESKQRTTIQAFIDELADYQGIRDIDNLRARVWRKSVPVIHLSMALAKVIDLMQNELKLIPTYFWFFENPNLVKEIIKYAANLKEEILASKIKITSADLLDVSYID